MKSLFAVFLSTGLLTVVNAADEVAVAEDETAKINYSVGYQIGSDFKYQEIEIRPDIVIQGIRDALSGDTALMSPAQMQTTMRDLGNHVAELKRKKREQILLQYIDTNLEYLEENGKQAGVTTSYSGLQYRILQQGKGKSPQAADTVVVNYRGKLVNGNEFDSSYKRGEPASFRVDQVIKGWTEALQMMKPGDKWQLVIPAGLAYGDKGMGKAISPHSTLTFEVELLSIQ